MNAIETYTWSCLRELMLTIDPARKGWCIDAGIGYEDFYFEWFHNFGYPTLAIEPFPAKIVSRCCKEYNIPLFEGALTWWDGVGMMYGDSTGLNTLEPDWWYGCREFEEKGTILCTSLKRLLSQYSINRVTVLKLDIEGAESAVIHQLPMLRSCPSILCFEFGGLVAKSERRGAWSKLNTFVLESSLQVLKEVGYNTLLAIIGGDGTRLVQRENTGNLDGLFVDSDVWGNIIAVRRSKYDLVAMAESEVRFAP